MKKNTVLFTIISFFAISCFIACGNLETIEEKDDAGNIIAKYTRNKENFAKEGVYTSYNAAGKTIEEANYQQNELHGERKIYTEEGILEVIEHYDRGQYAGLYELYHPNGQLKQTGNYENNKMTGIWKGFYEDGTLKEEVLFENNNENGAFKEYHENGTIAVEGAYRNGPFEIGILKEYNEAGEMTSRKKCLRGICKTIWTKEEGDIMIDEAAFEKMVEQVKSLENQ